MAVSQAPNKRDANAERTELEQLNKMIAATDARLTETFSDHATLPYPQP
jgi:hypothetical protein